MPRQSRGVGSGGRGGESATQDIGTEGVIV
jgi:hypothetical protein